MDSKKETPLDILSQILTVASELLFWWLCTNLCDMFIIETESNIEMEDLIDDFILFYFAGKHARWL